MTICAEKEKLITLAQAARQARSDKNLSPATLWRWHRIGVSGVRLETMCIGGARHTSVEALQRFFDAVTAARETKRTVRSSDSAAGTSDEPTEGGRSGRTRRELQAAGLL